MSVKIVAQNRKAHFNYEIELEVEAGIMLVGSEVKSLREGKANLNDAYVAEKSNELWLVNSMISEYKGANKFNHEPRRQRMLLLHKKEMQKIISKMAIKGYSLIPIKIYFKRGKAKVLLGMGKGKKLHDKRESIKERDDKRRQLRGED